MDSLTADDVLMVHVTVINHYMSIKTTLDQFIFYC